VRQLRVLLNNVEQYCSELRQGCGNQIFDYHHKISLVSREADDTSNSGSQSTCAGEKSTEQQLGTSTHATSTIKPSANSGQSLVDALCLSVAVFVDVVISEVFLF